MMHSCYLSFLFLFSLCIVANNAQFVNSSCFMYVTALNCIEVAQVGGTSFGTKQVSPNCLPIKHSFTWSSALDPVGMVAYAMGSSSSSSSRKLYTFSLSSGYVSFSPSVGSNYDAPYHLSADLRGNGRLYGLWLTSSGYSIVEIDRVKGKIVQSFADNWAPDNSSKWYPYFSSYDNITQSYVSLWSSSSSSSSIVRADVDTGKVSYITFTPPGNVWDFGVHPETGRTFFMVLPSNVPIAVLYEIDKVSGEFSLVAEVENTGSKWSLFTYLVFIHNGVCIYEPQDPSRNHPQPDNLMCSLFGNNGNTFSGSIEISTPNISTIAGNEGNYVPYVSHSIPVAC